MFHDIVALGGGPVKVQAVLNCFIFILTAIQTVIRLAYCMRSHFLLHVWLIVAYKIIGLALYTNLGLIYRANGWLYGANTSIMINWKQIKLIMPITWFSAALWWNGLTLHLSWSHAVAKEHFPLAISNNYNNLLLLDLLSSFFPRRNSTFILHPILYAYFTLC